MKTSIRQKFLLFAFIILGAIGLMGYAVYKSNLRQLNSMQWVHHTEQVISLSGSILPAARLVESATRGFVITNDSVFLRPLPGIAETTSANIAQLKQLTADNPRQQVRLDSLSLIMYNWWAFSRQLIRLRDTVGIPPATAYLATNHGNLSTAYISQVTHAIQLDEDSMLVARKLINQRSIAAFNRFWLAMLILMVLLALALLVGIGNYLSQTAKAEIKEKQLMHTEKRFKDTLDNMLEGAQMHDFNWRYIYVNDALVKYSTYKKEELLGFTLMEKYPGIEQTDLFKVMKRCMTGRVAGQLETEFIFPNGTKADYELTIQPVPEGIFVLSIDITERKKAQAKLQESELHYRMLIEQAADGIFLSDAQGNYVDVNPAGCKMLGYTSAEMMKLGISDIILEEELPRISNEVAKFKDGAVVPSEWRFKRKDGSQLLGELIGRQLPNGSLIGIVRDITERKKADEDLQKNESTLKDAQALAQLSSWEIDMVNNVLQWSDQQYVLLGLIKGEVTPSNNLFLSRVHPDDLALVQQGMDSAFRTFQNASSNFRLLLKSGEVKHVYCEWKFELDNSQKPVRIYGILQDITERKRFEEGQALFVSIVNSSDDAILSKTLDGIVTSWNHGAEKLFGYSANEIIGKSISVLMPPDLQNEESDIVKKIRKGEVIEHYETFRIRKDGRAINVSLTVSPIRDLQGKITGASKISRDITERKAAEEKIIKANRLYAFISAINQNIVHINDEEELLTNACNIALGAGQLKTAWINMVNVQSGRFDVTKMYGSKSAIDQSQKYADIDYADPLLRNTPSGRALVTGCYAVSNDVLNDLAMAPWREELLKNGVRSSVTFPIKKFGNVVGIFGFHSASLNFFDEQEISLLEEAVQDISFALENFEKAKKHLEAEERIVKNEKRFRAIIEKSADMITLSDEQGKLMYGSPDVEKVFGYTREEFMNKPVFEFMHPHEIAYMLEQRKDILSTPGKSVDVQQRLRHKNGDWIWCEGSYTNMLHDPDIRAMVVNFRNVSEKKKLEEQREYDHNNFTALINNTNDLMWSVDTGFNLLTFNQPFNSIVTLWSGKALQKGTNILSISFSEEQAQAYKRFYERAFAGEAFTEVEYTATPVEYWSEISLYPIRNGDKIVGAACHSRDITGRKKAEIAIKDLNENLEEHVQERTAELSEANKSLEAFSSTVSHDLRAPVRAILGFTKIIQKEHSTRMEPDMKELFGFIEDNGNRMNAIINDLLKLARYGDAKLKLEPVNMAKLINGVWLNISRTTTHHAVIELEELPEVTVDISMMQQVIVNMLSNAIKYSSKVQRPVVKIWCGQTATHCIFYFKDNGAGFDMSNYDRLFGAFQRFHSTREFEGTGVGLTLVKRIIEKHGGTVGAEAKVDEGATFYFTLPCTSN